MSKPPSRGIIAMVWNNFVKSITPSGIKKGEVVGHDHFGTKYFEIPADPSRGKRRASRWFQATDPEKFDQEIPAEWEAWLRGRRKDPPAYEEVMKNLAIRDRTIQKARELEAKEQEGRIILPPPPPDPEAKKSYPTYSDYERRPGDWDKEKDK